MLEPEDAIELGEDTSFAAYRSQQQPLIATLGQVLANPMAASPHSGGSLFPLVLRPPAFPYDDGNGHADAGQGPWLHCHPQRGTGCGLCNSSCSGTDTCTQLHLCQQRGDHGQHRQRHDYRHHVPELGGDLGPPCRDGGQQPSHSLQHLLAVGSRQWGNGGWWDGRGLLRVKIYDFAVYADPEKAASVLRSAAVAGRVGRLPHGGAGGSGMDGPAVLCPADLLVPAGSSVDMSITIRACRNLPLPLLGQEFERILQRRHAKAGGHPDDPALRELLSYFSRERLPRNVVICGGGDAGQDAVRKGAAITFSRRSGGELVTEAGGQVLGRLLAPALTEALFDLYLGDQPVSKRAKAAAGDALLRLAEAGGSAGQHAAIAAADGGVRGGAGRLATGRAPGRYRYQLQPGERLHCQPGAGLHQPEACLLEIP